MNKNLLDFFGTHEGTAFKFNLELRNLRELLRSKTKMVAQSIDSPKGFPRFGFWSSITDGDETYPYIYDSCYCDIKVGGVPVRVEVSVYINKRGWEIFVWPHEAGDFSKVRSWFETQKVRPVRVSQNDKQWFYAENIAEDKVRPKFQELLEVISKASGAKTSQTRSGSTKRRQ